MIRRDDDHLLSNQLIEFKKPNVYFLFDPFAEDAPIFTNLCRWDISGPTSISNRRVTVSNHTGKPGPKFDPSLSDGVGVFGVHH